MQTKEDANNKIWKDKYPRWERKQKIYKTTIIRYMVDIKRLVETKKSRILEKTANTNWKIW